MSTSRTHHTCGHLAIPCVACKPAAPAPVAPPLTDAQLSVMESAALAKIPEKADDGGHDRWLGPCADSFCFASCENPHCRYEKRLGDTPSKHNAKVDAMVSADPVLILVAQ